MKYPSSHLVYGNIVTIAVIGLLFDLFYNSREVGGSPTPSRLMLRVLVAACCFGHEPGDYNTGEAVDSRGAFGQSQHSAKYVNASTHIEELKWSKYE